MIFLRIIFTCLLLASGASHAFEKCTQRQNCDNTRLGKLELISSSELDEYAYILLNGVEIYQVKASSIVNVVTATADGWISDKKNLRIKMLITYSYTAPKKINDNRYQYNAYVLLDFSGEKVVVSNEFYPPADYDAPLKWVSWGKKNSVIAFNDGSRFRYENGQVVMIDDGKNH